MRCTIIFAVVILAVIHAKPHLKKSTESFSSADPKFMRQNEHHKHSHPPRTPPTPVTEEVVTFTPEYPAGSDATVEAFEISAQGVDVTTAPVVIVLTDDIPNVETTSRFDVTVEVVTVRA